MDEMMQALRLPTVYAKLVDLAYALGARNICNLPGCWEHQIDDQWWCAGNGGKVERQCSTGISVPPCTFYLEFNGWPAGFVGPAGGIVAAGEAANEDSLLAAIEARMR